MPQPFPILARPSSTVVASPALAAETIICSVVIPATGSPTSQVSLIALATFTVGTSGTAVRLRLRNGGLTGTVVGDTGALTGGVAAAGLLTIPIIGFDTPGEVTSLAYVLTLQVTGGSAASTVSAAIILPFLMG